MLHILVLAFHFTSVLVGLVVFSTDEVIVVQALTLLVEKGGDGNVSENDLLGAQMTKQKESGQFFHYI